jgi:hypothetical protein
VEFIDGTTASPAHHTAQDLDALGEFATVRRGAGLEAKRRAQRAPSPHIATRERAADPLARKAATCAERARSWRGSLLGEEVPIALSAS